MNYIHFLIYMLNLYLLVRFEAVKLDIGWKRWISQPLNSPRLMSWLS